MHKRH